MEKKEREEAIEEKESEKARLEMKGGNLSRRTDRQTNKSLRQLKEKSRKRQTKGYVCVLALSLALGCRSRGKRHLTNMPFRPITQHAAT